MTPEEELQRLNRLLVQYETVYRTTPDPDQKERALRQVRELRAYREKLRAVLVVEETPVGQQEEKDALAPFPLLVALREENLSLPPVSAVAPFAVEGATPTASQEEAYNLSLYVRRLEREFIPFLTSKLLKLDFKYSLDRDAFYGSLQALQRRIDDYRDECRRIAEGSKNREMEMETRKRAVKVARLAAVEGAKLFRALHAFATDLVDDAAGDGVKCLNAESEIAFDSLEGERMLQGMQVKAALGELGALAAEAVEYLNVPEIDTQENGRADRH